MTVAYTVLEYGDLIVAALAASDRLCFIYDVDNDISQNHRYNNYGEKMDSIIIVSMILTYVIVYVIDKTKMIRSGECCYYQVAVFEYSVSYSHD